MKKIFIYAAVAALAMTAISCQKESSNENVKTSNVPLVFTASIDGAMDTKTTLTSEKKVNWEASDEITVNGVVYTATPKSNATKAYFAKKDSLDADPTGIFNAFYPTGIQSGTAAGGTLPAEQTYAAGKITNVPMFATSTTTSLSFKNICAVLAVTVKSEDFPSVKSIKLSSSNCALSGAFTVSGGQAATLTDATTVANTVTLNCAPAVTTASEGTVFYIAIPAQTYRNLKIELSADGSSFDKAMTTKKDVNIAVAVNTVYPITFKADTSVFLPGEFSVSPTKKVHFAKGNLQATKKSDGAITANGDNNSKWDIGFAAHQYDYIGAANIRHNAFGDVIDLFGWSSNETGKYLYGISTSAVPGNYGTSVQVSSFNDWGRIITLPGNYEGTCIWRTLTKAEWAYLINEGGDSGRSDAYRFVKATVNGVKGLIIFPDNYIHPEGPALPVNLNDKGQFFTGHLQIHGYKYL